MRDAIKRLAQPLSKYKTDALIVPDVAILQHGRLAARLGSIHALETYKNVNKQYEKVTGASPVRGSVVK